MTTAKALAAPKSCVRCACTLTQATGVVRALCSSCDLELQTMHHALEHTLYNKTFYVPDPATEVPSLDWLNERKYKVSKPPTPERRDLFRFKKPNEALTL